MISSHISYVSFEKRQAVSIWVGTVNLDDIAQLTVSSAKLSDRLQLHTLKGSHVTKHVVCLKADKLSNEWLFLHIQHMQSLLGSNLDTREGFVASMEEVRLAVLSEKQTMNQKTNIFLHVLAEPFNFLVTALCLEVSRTSDIS